MNTMTLRATDQLARDTRLVFELLEKLQGGMLEIRLPGATAACLVTASMVSPCTSTTKPCLGRCWPRGHRSDRSLPGWAVGFAGYYRPDDAAGG